MIHAKGTRLSATSTPTDVNAKPRTVQPGESQSGKAQCAQRLSAMKLPHRKEPVANKDLINHLLSNAPTATGIAILRIGFHSHSRRCSQTTL